MLKRAMSCGLPVPAAEYQKRLGQVNPAAAISRDFDPVKDPYRPIPWTDVVHKSVTLRAGAHNPPKGLRVVDDDGQFLSKGFGE